MGQKTRKNCKWAILVLMSVWRGRIPFLQNALGMTQKRLLFTRVFPGFHAVFHKYQYSWTGLPEVSFHVGETRRNGMQNGQANGLENIEVWQANSRNFPKKSYLLGYFMDLINRWVRQFRKFRTVFKNIYSKQILMRFSC